MYMEHISRAVQYAAKKYNERDPFRLCREMGIILLRQPMGSQTNSCKGFYFVQSKKRAIVLNSDLSDELQRVVLAHEIGHSVLHRNVTGVKSFHDFSLFDEISKMEYEANLFAAELLMCDEDVLELLNEDISFFSAAGRLFVPPELLDFKFRLLKRKGYKLVDSPFSAKSNFLKNIDK